MNKVFTKRFEMRLTPGHIKRLRLIIKRRGLSSSADAVRYLIDNEFKAM